MGGFPFLLADIKMIVAGRTPPVNAPRGLARLEMPELPEGLAGAGASPAVNAMGNSIGDNAGLHEKLGQTRGQKCRLAGEILTSRRDEIQF